MKRTALLLSVAALAFAPAAAMAQFSDGFEAYSDQQLLDNVGGWFGWDDDSNFAGVATTAQAHSGKMSVEIAGADAVHPFSGFTSGQWTLTAWQYIGEGDHTADTFFIINNIYNHGGPYQWTAEMQFDVDTKKVLDDFRDESNDIDIAFDRWVELRFEIDLDADTMDSYYDGTLLSSGQYAIRGDDPEIANIDLFSTGGTAYYDDISITPEPTSCLLLLLGSAVMRRRRR